MSLVLQARQWLFARTGRFWLNACFNLFPGLITCVMAGVLAYPMYKSPRPILPLSWLGLLAYAIGGIGYSIAALRKILNERTADRWFERFDKGLCQQCGFDLRSCTSVRCSECGTWHGRLPARYSGGRSQT